MINKLCANFRDFLKYIPLLKNLIARELKKKYRQSFLGYVWCVLNPLLVMLILTVVFSTMFNHSIANFPVYLFTGRMIFSFITESTNSLARSITNNGSLMRKTRIPYYIFPLSNFCTSVVNFLFTLAAFALVLIFTHTAVSYHILMFPLVALETFVFSFGLGLFLSQANLFVRDTAYIYNVVTTGWMYLTPIFYPISNLNETLQYVISTFNPAYFYVAMTRSIFLDNAWPDGMLLLKGAIVAFVFLGIGIFAYCRSRDRVILYI